MQFDSDFRMLIGGEMIAGSRSFAVLNPATEQEVGQAPDATEEDLDRAVAAARAAFPAWSATSIDERKGLILALGQAILAEVDPLARLVTAEQGKPYADAMGDVGGGGYWMMGATGLDLPVTVHEDSAERYAETRRVPLGVVGAIVAWNFPILMAGMKLAPALLAGNTVVLKPSPFTPLSTLKLGEIASRILPPGVLNVVSGGDALGPWMTSHPGIDKISFTGSSATGKKVMQSASATLKRVTLELGGNDPAIVLPDVDVATVAEQLFWAAFENNGQICVATKRMYVHQDIYEPLRDALVAYAATVQVGDGAEQGTRIGPINNRPQYERVLGLIQDARDKGYTFAMGDQPPEGPGYFIPITILDNPPENSRIVREEQFGPVLPLLRYTDIDEVVARANDCEYGLGASVWGKDEEQAMAVARRIQSGSVWINEVRHLTPGMPFGGHKQSGMGVEGGVEGLMEFTAAQTITRKKAPA